MGPRMGGGGGDLILRWGDDDGDGRISKEVSQITGETCQKYLVVRPYLHANGCYQGCRIPF